MAIGWVDGMEYDDHVIKLNRAIGCISIQTV